MSFATITTGLVTYKLFSDAMITQIAESRVDVLEKISENMGTIKKTMSTMFDLFYYNKPISTILTHEKLNNEDIRQIVEELNKLNEQYATALNNKELSMEYVIALENGFSYAHNGWVNESLIDYYKRKLWYRDITKNLQKITWVSTYDNVITKEKDFVFSAASPIKNLNNTEGVFLVNISEDYISDTYKNLIDENSIYIIDSTGKIVSHHDNKMVGFNFYNMNFFNDMFGEKDFNIIEKSGEKYLFSKHYNEDFDWIIVEEIPLKIILKPLTDIRNMLFIILGIILCIGVVFSLIISRRTSRPLKKLCNQLELVGRGNNQVEFDIKGWLEIDKISEECNSMVDRINHLVDDVRETEYMKRKAELNFLQMQINPHFMYNTLFSIKCLVVMGHNEQAEKMLRSFIVFLKSILSSSNEMITIENEIDILKEYVYIQKYRFGDAFDIYYNYDKSIGDYKIPRLLLQPIVENAIIHGIEPSHNRGKIDVNVEKDDEYLLITIIDDGVGMELEDKNRDNLQSSQSTSIGIDNVKDRIRLNYGERGYLKVESEKGKGTKVMLCLPLIND